MGEQCHFPRELVNRGRIRPPSLFVMNALIFLHCILGGAVVQRVECWTCDEQVMGTNPTRGKSCVATLGKLFTPMCLCHEAV